MSTINTIEDDASQSEGVAPTNADKQMANVKDYFGDRTPKLAQLNSPDFSTPLQKVLAGFKAVNEVDIITVACGGDPAGLCAIVFLKADEVGIQEFVRLNPSFEGGTSILWRGLILVLVRISGWRPASQNPGGFLWISDGRIPIMDILPGRQPGLLRVGEIIPTITFDELKWPSDLDDRFLLQRIQDKHGYFLIKNTIEYQFNHTAIAAYLAARYGLVYDGFRRGFKAHKPKPTSELITETQVHGTILEWLHELSSGVSDILPAYIIRERDVKVILMLLKSRCAQEPAGEREGLLKYLQARIEHRAGGSVTSNEVLEDYQKYCRVHGLLVFPRRNFLSELPAVLRRQYAVLKSHCVPRDTNDGRHTERNGFFGLAFKNIQDCPDEKDSQGTQDV